MDADWSDLMEFRIILVADLPLPRNLFRCDHSERFQALIEALGDDERAAAIKFDEDLTDDERAACHYHRINWVSVADRAVEIIERLGERPNRADLRAAIGEAGLPQQETFELSGLLCAYPMSIMSDGNYRDGQHRGCALRFSGAARTVVQAYE